MSADSTQSAGPLTGIRVIECGVLLAAPFCARLLADFGAEVIKIEPPNQGDPMRSTGQALIDGKSLWWPNVARNKKCITLNLRLPEGQEILRKFATQADVLLENFRPGTFEGWGLGYDVLRQLNPGLVFARVSGYGQGVSIGDSLAGMFSALGILMALYHRDVNGGHGQVIDTALYEAVFAVMEGALTEYDKTGYVRTRTGTSLPGFAPSNLYPCRDDKWIIIAAQSDKLFSSLCRVMGREELIEDPRFATSVGVRSPENEAFDHRIWHHRLT